jgi:HlyD family secretion protein
MTVASTSATGTTAADSRLVELFPEEHARRRRRGLSIPAVVVVVVAVVGALLATDAFGSDEPGYRTGTVARRTVESTVQGVASIEPVTQSAVAFPVAGTVATVPVAVGQTVAVGQVLATLDAQELEATLHEKQLALAQAQLALTDALNGDATGPASSGGGGDGTSNRGGTSRSAATTAAVVGSPRIVLTAAPLGGGPTSVPSAQQAVVAAQRRVDQAVAAAATTQTTTQATCAAAGVATGGSPSPSTTTSTTSTSTPSGPELAACQSALADLLGAQQAVSSAQRAQTTAEHALDALLAQEATSSASGSRPEGSQSGAGTSTATTGPSAADLASYQRAVDSAAAAVAVADQAVDQGTIVSPIAGTVSAVDLAVGQSVGAASTSEHVVVTGAGGYEVSTNLTVTQVPDVAPGATARVVPDGSGRTYAGTVVSISALPSSVTSAATNYLVVVGLDDPHAALTNGDLGTVTIVTKRVRGVVSVPTSAVTAVGGRHVVQVLGGGGPQTVRVGVGVVGPTWTQITSGLESGARVVIADLSTPLPGSATSAAAGTNGTAANRIPGLFRGSGLGGAGGASGGFRGFAGFGGGQGGARRGGERGAASSAAPVADRCPTCARNGRHVPTSGAGTERGRPSAPRQSAVATSRRSRPWERAWSSARCARSMSSSALRACVG